MLLFLLLILGHLGYKVCNCANGWDDLFSIIYVFNSLTSCLLFSILCFDSANACERFSTNLSLVCQRNGIKQLLDE